MPPKLLNITRPWFGVPPKLVHNRRHDWYTKPDSGTAGVSDAVAREGWTAMRTARASGAVTATRKIGGITDTPT
ncbi:hypothetical protein [Candidatus Protofrankia datiscae]|uniref:hypothetical protein n=1 Tax=Candidatus Protofrankia datiscae TaxID=2716812 RepID=UPI0005B87607|nr:hypothetical protein [Candidatus Protofrankia datiscae]